MLQSSISFSHDDVLDYIHKASGFAFTVAAKRSTFLQKNVLRQSTANPTRAASAHAQSHSDLLIYKRNCPKKGNKKKSGHYGEDQESH